MGENTELIHDIELSVPLSNSNLFDVHNMVLCKRLCDKYPGLHFEYTGENKLRVFGKLNDYWYERYCKEVLSMGEIE